MAGTAVANILERWPETHLLHIIFIHGGSGGGGHGSRILHALKEVGECLQMWPQPRPAGLAEVPERHGGRAGGLRMRQRCTEILVGFWLMFAGLLSKQDRGGGGQALENMSRAVQTHCLAK